MNTRMTTRAQRRGTLWQRDDWNLLQEDGFKMMRLVPILTKLLNNSRQGIVGSHADFLKVPCVITAGS
jgi:hypothetical protein